MHVWNEKLFSPIGICKLNSIGSMLEMLPLASYKLVTFVFLFSLNGIKRRSVKMKLKGKSILMNISKKSNIAITLVVLLT